MRTRFLLTILLILIPFKFSSAFVFSNGSTSEDSVAVSVFITDSLGNPSLTHADSFFVSIIGPSGDSIIAIMGLASTEGLAIDSFYSDVTGWNYIFSDAIEDVDGSGGIGSYELRLCAKDVSPQYVNCVTRDFQIVSSPLSSQLEKISEIIDSLYVVIDSINCRTATALASLTVDSIHERRPDVNMALISTDATAADNFETMLDGTGGSKLTLGQMSISGAHGDSGSFLVTNTSGTAVKFTSLGGNGAGLHASGHGNGEGIKGTGGMTGGGHGIQGTGGIGGSDIAGDIAGSLNGAVNGNLYGFATPTDTNSSGMLIARTDDSLAFQGEASGLSKGQIADTLIKAGMVRYNQPDSVLHLRGLHLIGTQPGDTALIAIGNGSGHGGYFGSGETGHGGYFRGGLTSGHGIIGWTTNGHGMALYGSREKAGLYCEATDSGAGAFFIGGDESNASSAGTGVRIRGRVDDGLHITAGTDDNKHGIQVDGGSGNGGDALRILGYGAGGDGISISANDGSALDIDTRNELVRTVWGYPIDTSWASGSFGDSAKSWSASSPLGGGIFPVTITVLDSTSLQAVPQVRVSVLNHGADITLANGLSDENGLCSFNLDDGTYLVTGFSPGYQFEALDSLVIAGSSSDTLTGYRFVPGEPSSPDLCRVYGFLLGLDGLPIQDASVAIELQTSQRYSTAFISPYKKEVVTDSTGYFHLDVIPTDKLSNKETYTVTAGNSSGIIFRQEITVPDEPTWQITWE